MIPPPMMTTRTSEFMPGPIQDRTDGNRYEELEPDGQNVP